MSRGTFIENEEAYERAIERRIRENRIKGGRTRWFAAHDDAGTLYDWLYGIGEFEPTWNDQDRRIDHPLSFYARGEFMCKMRESLEGWGGLTDGQHAAVAKSFAAAKVKLAEREAERMVQHTIDSGTQYVGVVGERRVFELTVERTVSFENDFGWTHINVCRDADNNIVVYKGSKLWEKNSTVNCKATVKLHSMRDGVPQTLIQRPTTLKDV